MAGPHDDWPSTTAHAIARMPKPSQIAPSVSEMLQTHACGQNGLSGECEEPRSLRDIDGAIEWHINSQAGCSSLRDNGL